jgi:hypothetical protein
MQSLEEFYEFMQRLQPARREFAAACLAGITNAMDIAVLENALHAIDRLDGDGDVRTLLLGGDPAPVTLDYERRELSRDITFLDRTTQEFQRQLGADHKNFENDVEECVQFLRDRPVSTFISDRDGTVNNYCGHYRSSHQSVYNAVFLSRFVRAIRGESVILTSAPLEPHGILELSTMPERTVTIAGSKGREFVAVDGSRDQMAIPEEQQSALTRLNDRLGALLEKPEYRPFSLIGSGVQYKFGQTTIARQDIHSSIDTNRSDSFLEVITNLVREIDPKETIFQIEDTGKDVEIMLTVEGSREFTKGDGVSFLAQKLPIDFAGDGFALVCGDTASDLPMVTAVAELAGVARTLAVFVTGDEELGHRVQSTVPESLIVSSPDVLVTALNRIASEFSR